MDLMVMGPVGLGVLVLAHKVIGTLLVVVGAIVAPTPIPLGIPMIIIGLALLAPYFKPIQRFVKRLRYRYPSFDATMERMYAKCPPVVRATIEKTRLRKRRARGTGTATGA